MTWLRVVAALAAMATFQPPSFRSEVRLVVLHATVRDDRGALVSGLDAGAFRVFENGRRQTLSLFRNDDVPVSLGLVIDNSGSMRTKRSRVEAAALAFARASNKEDEMFVVNFADTARIDVPFTSDLERLEAGIGRVDSIGGTALRDAVRLAERYSIENGARDRRALVVITDGNDNASETSLDAIESEAAQRDMAVYAVGLLSDAGSKAHAARHDLNALADATGGVALYPTDIDEIEGAVVDLARQIRAQYTLAYAPANQALDGTYRKIRVEARVTNRSGGSTRLTVRTRTGYHATRDQMTTASSTRS